MDQNVAEMRIGTILSLLFTKAARCTLLNSLVRHSSFIHFTAFSAMLFVVPPTDGLQPTLKEPQQTMS